MNEADENDSNNNEDGRGEDLITLSAFGINTKWRFPNDLTSCPTTRCNFVSDSRSTLIGHYKTKHASHALLCDVCNKPIICNSKYNFRRHFWIMHRGKTIPHGLGNGSIEFPSKRKKISIQTVEYQIM